MITPPSAGATTTWHAAALEPGGELATGRLGAGRLGEVQRALQVARRVQAGGELEVALEQRARRLHVVEGDAPHHSSRFRPYASIFLYRLERGVWIARAVAATFQWLRWSARTR